MIELLCERFEFRRQKIEQNVPNKPGIYIFWLKKRCIYVGQAKNLNYRLLSHWKGSHNDDLALYIKTQKNNLEINFAKIEKDNLFDDEQFFIDKCKPEQNKIRARVKK